MNLKRKMIGITLLVIGALAIFIYVFIEIKRMKHKLFALFMIGMLVFAYVSAVIVFRGEDIDYKSMGGLMKAGKLYFSWLGSAFGNVKTVTTYAIKMDWSSAESGTSVVTNSTAGN